MKTSIRKGFSLVELLVVIAIIGVMFSLLLPAVQQVRESGRRLQCINSLKQLAIGVTNFSSSKGRMPASQEALFPSNALANQRWASWFVLISPYVDQGAIWHHWNDPANPNPPKPYISFLNCPSSGSVDAGRPTTSYVCNAGFYPRPGVDTAFLAAPFNFQALQRSANGVFHDRANFVNQVSSNIELLPKVSLTDMRLDGTSFTALLSENLTAADWPADGSPDPQITPFPVTAAGPAKSNLMVWLYAAENGATVNPNPITGTVIPASAVAPHMRINGTGAASHPAETWRPSSQHSGGIVVMAFVDGSVRPISKNIPYHVYQSLLTPKNSKSDMPQNQYVISGSDIE